MQEKDWFSQEDLVVALHTGDGNGYTGVVVETFDVSGGGARVVTDFPRKNSPSLPIGDDAALIFSEECAPAAPISAASGRAIKAAIGSEPRALRFIASAAPCPRLKTMPLGAENRPL